MDFTQGLFVFIFGVVFGSFLNVCIYRLPQGLSIAWPSSYCPHCRKSIAWFDNIPILSYVLLGARCRSCKTGISPRYILVELLSASLWLGLWLAYGLSWPFFVSTLFLSLLLVVLMTDIETGLIPDAISLPGLALGLLISAVYPGLVHEELWYRGLLASGAGALVGGGILALVGWLGSLVFKKESMGGGDIKLLAMIGSFIGWQKVILTFFVAPFIALPFALYFRYFRKNETIPYGPYLAIAGALQFFYGDIFWKYLFK